MTKLSTAFAGLLIGLGVSACFSYVPAEPEAIPAGQKVRVHITRSGRTELDDIAALGSSPTGGPILEGTLVDVSGDQLIVSYPIFGVQPGFPTPREQQVPIARNQIVQVDRREIHKKRTALFAGGTAAGLLILAFGVFNLQVDPAVLGEPLPGGDDEARLPILFSIPVP